MNTFKIANKFINILLETEKFNQLNFGENKHSIEYKQLIILKDEINKEYDFDKMIDETYNEVYNLYIYYQDLKIDNVLENKILYYKIKPFQLIFRYSTVTFLYQLYNKYCKEKIKKNYAMNILLIRCNIPHDIVNEINMY